jgi:acyl-CoA thioester hydrolase
MPPASAAPGRAPPTGVLDGGVHVLPVRVYYEDTDAGGIVYHANYLRFAERARAELLRLFSADNRSLLDKAGLAFVARECLLDYIAPARLDDALEIHTRIVEVRGASLRAAQTVRRDGQDLVRIAIRLACIRSDGRPGRLPENLREALAALACAAA